MDIIIILTPSDFAFKNDRIEMEIILEYLTD